MSNQTSRSNETAVNSLKRNADERDNSLPKRLKTVATIPLSSSFKSNAVAVQSTLRKNNNIKADYINKRSISPNQILDCGDTDEILTSDPSLNPNNEIVFISNRGYKNLGNFSHTNNSQIYTVPEEYILLSSDNIDNADITNRLKTPTSKSDNCNNPINVKHLKPGIKFSNKSMDFQKNDVPLSIKESAKNDIDLLVLSSNKEKNFSFDESEMHANKIDHISNNVDFVKESFRRHESFPSNCPIKSEIVNCVHLDAVKKPMMIASKKLVSDVTQTTAKVSIGNTTISVPLLKPINSSKIFASKYLNEDMKKNQQHSTPKPQSALNLNQILNVKRSQNTNQPTIVSLSQVQIKPIPNAKIVQAKVISKKPFQLPQVTASLSSSIKLTSGIASLKTNSNKQSSSIVNRDNSNGHMINENLLIESEKSILKSDVIKDESKLSGDVENRGKIKPNLLINCKIRQYNSNEHQNISSKELSSLVSERLEEQESSPFSGKGTCASSSVSISISKQCGLESLRLPTPENKYMTSGDNSKNDPSKSDSDWNSFEANSTSLSYSINEDKNHPITQNIKTKFANEINPNVGITKSNSLCNTNVLENKSLSFEITDLHFDKIRTVETQISSTLIEDHLEENKKKSQELVLMPIESSSKVNQTKTIKDATDNFSFQKGHILNVNDDKLINENCEKLASNQYIPTISSNKVEHCKLEENHNVLLKQLLQNSTVHNMNALQCNIAKTTVFNQALPARKVINVRAPSLGLVSSLEAQLARPVIPPVPANNSDVTVHIRTESRIENFVPASSENIVSEKETKLKQNVTLISKETSFVSNPELNPLLLNKAACQQAPSNLQTSTKSSKIFESNSSNSQRTCAENTFNNADDYINESISNSLENIESGICSTYMTSCKNYDSQFNNSKSPNQTLSHDLKTITAKNVGKTQRRISVDSRKAVSYDDAFEKPEICAETNTSARKKNFSIFSKIKKCSDVSILHNAVVSKCIDKEKTFLIKSKSTNKNPDIRKKRKRENQKHRRIISKTPYDVSTNTISNLPMVRFSNLKKRVRKTQKIDEDYDKFIENLMIHIRQMHSLKVLEPLLNKNFTFWNIAGASIFIPTTINKSQKFNRVLYGEYGKANSHSKTSLYDITNSKKNEKLLSMQNNFYDQEFSSVKAKRKEDKKTTLIDIVRKHNIESFETIIYKSRNTSVINNALKICTSNCYMLSENINYYIGRKSPTIPFMNPSASLSQIQDENISITNKKSRSNMAFKIGNNAESEHFGAVFLTLSSSVSENILNVLKELAGVLHISTPQIYCVVNCPESLFYKQNKFLVPQKNFKERKQIYKNNLQKILNRQYKMCHFCGQIIKSLGVKKKKINSLDISRQNLDVINLYFCNKECYLKYNYEGHKVHSVLKTKKDLNYIPMNIGSNILNLRLKETNGINITLFDSHYFNSKEFINFPTEKEICDNLIKMEVANVTDSRKCVFCHQIGDGSSNGPSRLLNFEVDKWVHLNCALWSNEVYETISGGLMNFSTTHQMSLNQQCVSCQIFGATVKCFKSRCNAIFHLPCAVKDNCVFYKNKTMYCQQHASKTEKENELTSLSVNRCVFVDRDENQQVASVIHNSELTNLLRVGSLTVLNVGQLLPHQLESFHTIDYIYPIGYKVIRFYWSMNRPNKRSKYICSIAEVSGRPEFRIRVEEPMEKDIEFHNTSPKKVWQQVLSPIVAMRKKHEFTQLFHEFITGEDLFGLTEPAIIRIIESLPGIETLTDYRFKYGRNPLLEFPLAINPSGAARTEAKQRQLISWRKPHTQCTSTSYNQRIAISSPLIVDELACPYSKQFVHSKSSQYKKMKQEWRNNVYLARSKIQGLGLYAARDIEKHNMIIEYIGEVIRTEVSEIREKQYASRNRGIYMFRLDEERVVDATLSGGLARYINHSCNPNCMTEIVDVDRELRIIIFAKRKIGRGEELSYDYKFDFEDDAHKIPCMCGSPNCRKWMN